MKDIKNQKKEMTFIIEKAKNELSRIARKSKKEKKSEEDRRVNRQPVIKEYPNIIGKIEINNIPRIAYKERVRKDVTILLIENTANTIKEKENLLKIAKNFVTTGLICIINYGKETKMSKVFEASSFENKICFNPEEMNNETCLFDALVELEALLSKMYIIENSTQKIIAKDVTIIGIGTCKDSCSKASKEEGIDAFCKVIKKSQATTKYFCITEDYFLDAAEIGFSSIGAISKKY